MHLPVPEELQAVFDRAQEPVRAGQTFGVLAGYVPARRQGAQGGQSGRLSHAVVLATVHQLEQLYRELDVPYPAATELDLPLGEALAGDGLLGPRFHGPQRPQFIGTEGPAPHPPGRLFNELSTQFGEAGHRPRFQQGLEFPRLCPPVPVSGI